MTKYSNPTWSERIEEHYRNNILKTKKLLYRSCGDQAEDVIHNAYERALKYQTSFNGEDFDKWFRTILRNCIMDFKREQMGSVDPIILNEFDHVGEECSGIFRKIWREIKHSIKKERPEHSEVLNLYFNLGYSYKDISAVTSYTYFNSYRIVARFKEELAKRYRI